MQNTYSTHRHLQTNVIGMQTSTVVRTRFSLLAVVTSTPTRTYDVVDWWHRNGCTPYIEIYENQKRVFTSWTEYENSGAHHLQSTVQSILQSTLDSKSVVLLLSKNHVHEHGLIALSQGARGGARARAVRRRARALRRRHHLLLPRAPRQQRARRDSPRAPRRR